MKKEELKGGEEKEDFKNSENLNEDIKEGEMAKKKKSVKKKKSTSGYRKAKKGLKKLKRSRP